METPEDEFGLIMYVSPPHAVSWLSVYGMLCIYKCPGVALAKQFSMYRHRAEPLREFGTNKKADNEEFQAVLPYLCVIRGHRTTSDK